MTATAHERGREIVLRGRSLRDALISLARLAEDEFPHAVAGYTLVDPTGTYLNEAVFPSLPPVFESSIVLIPVAAHAGTCVEAIRAGTPVLSNDILGDARFDLNWRDLCLRCGVKSVQSIPIRKGAGPTKGTFVLGYRDVSHDASWNMPLMEVFAALASDAIRLYRTLAVNTHGPRPGAEA
jgi:GAF domain-containing protein